MQIQLRDGKSVWKQEWKQIADKRHFFRSRWEYRYALYLQFLKDRGDIKDWLYEPKIFYFEGIKRGTTNYKPDFLCIHKNDTEEFVEIKGFMDAKSKTKISRMAKYYPDVRLRVIGKEFFTKNLKAILPDW